MLYGSCMQRVNGRPVSPPVPLRSFNAAWRFILVQKRLYPEVLITDSSRAIVAQALEDQIVYPPTWRHLEYMRHSQL